MSKQNDSDNTANDTSNSLEKKLNTVQATFTEQIKNAVASREQRMAANTPNKAYIPTKPVHKNNQLTEAQQRLIAREQNKPS